MILTLISNEVFRQSFELSDHNVIEIVTELGISLEVLHKFKNSIDIITIIGFTSK